MTFLRTIDVTFANGPNQNFSTWKNRYIISPVPRRKEGKKGRSEGTMKELRDARTLFEAYDNETDDK